MSSRREFIALLGGADLRMGAPRGRESRASTSGTSLAGTTLQGGNIKARAAVPWLLPR